MNQVTQCRAWVSAFTDLFPGLRERTRTYTREHAEGYVRALPRCAGERFSSSPESPSAS